MADLIPPAGQIMDVYFLQEETVSPVVEHNAALLFLLRGTAELETEGTRRCLNTEDFCLIEAGVPFSLRRRECDFCLVVLQIDMSLLRRLSGQNNLTLNCDSSRQKGNVCEELRARIRHIAALLQNGKPDRLLLGSLYYQLLACLAADFSLTSAAKPVSETDSLPDILACIEERYATDLRLSDLARMLYFSPNYVSKYLHRRLGMPFRQYLRQVRLSHAARDLSSTQKTMSEIALANGFSGVSDFNRGFRTVYRMTPSAFRAQNRTQEPPAQNQAAPPLPRIDLHDPAAEQTIEQDVQRYIPLRRAWNRMINIGAAADLLRTDVQQQVLYLTRTLGFSYIRFWDIWAPELYLSAHPAEAGYNFSRLDRILDFLVTNHLAPFWEMGFKPVRLLRNTADYIISEERPLIFASATAYENFCRQFFMHYTDRYGLREVEGWIFEQWIDPRCPVREKSPSYFDTFEALWHAAKDCSPHIRVGGGGLRLVQDDLPLEQVLRLWRSRPCTPDFLSLYCYPYERGEYAASPTDEETLRSRDPDYLHHLLQECAAAIRSADFLVSEVYVTEWNLTVSSRNVLNDSPFKGAYLLKNIIDSTGEADLLGYWLGSDLFGEYSDTSHLLSGSGGLLNRDGIRKAAYFAMQFMARMQDALIYKGANCMITSDTRGHLAIACHNFKALNFRYYASPENSVTPEQQADLFDDSGNLRLHFRLRHLPAGRYLLRVSSVSEQDGNIQREWRRLDCTDSLTPQEIDYLRQICQPRLTIRTLSANGGLLEFDTMLVPQEIQFLELTRSSI